MASFQSPCDQNLALRDADPYWVLDHYQSPCDAVVADPDPWWIISFGSVAASDDDSAVLDVSLWDWTEIVTGFSQIVSADIMVLDVSIWNGTDVMTTWNQETSTNDEIGDDITVENPF